MGICWNSERQARDALAAIEVENAPLPAVLDMGSALADAAPLVHPGWESYEVLTPGGMRGGNVAWEASVDRGDVDAAFARNDVTVVESSFRVGRQNHLSFEPRAVMAHFEDGRYHIETSTQVPWTVRNTVAALLAVPASSIRVTVPPVGGGFGLKFDCALEPFAALLARKSGRPVRLVNSREEEMTTCLFRENAEIRIRSAITPEGSIAGREAVVLMDCGATVHGYQSDISRSFVYGKATVRQRQVWDQMRKGQDVAFAAAKLGTPAGKVDDAVRAYYESLGWGPGYKLPGTSHRTGHGIGRDGHEPVFRL